MSDQSGTGTDPPMEALTSNNPSMSSKGEKGTREEVGGAVESPTSPTSTNVLARFEFETGRGREGSKILMVEWDCSRAQGVEPSPEDRDGWTVSWEGKSTTYALDDHDKGTSPMLRLYFLLPENAPIPPVVTISHPPTGRALATKCLPAIFAPGLGVSPPDAGTRGVLHTIWAKKRLAQLEEEIHEELQTNSEGIALEMVVQERLWLIDHFGFVDSNPRMPSHPALPLTPLSPRSPIGGRLGEMLKGLRLSTSPADLTNTPGKQGSCTLSRDPIAPPAIPTFYSRHLTSLKGKTPQQPIQPSYTASVPNLSVPKPGYGSGAGAGTGTAVASLDAMIGNANGNTQPAAPSTQTKDTEDELFALPMSPRSPEMKTSPFSFLK
ncbi:hypothetical protein GGS20DRAFT_169127 [Poronia punctata]|nr:hypothetical protein GGS20DRAFT_169127 [Poronia punctata]